MCTSYANIHKGKNDILKFAKKTLSENASHCRKPLNGSSQRKKLCLKLLSFLEESWQNAFNLKALVHNP